MNEHIGEQNWLKTLADMYNLGQPKAEKQSPKNDYNDLARIKQWCGNYSDIFAPKEIADFAAALAILTMPAERSSERAIVFGCISEDTSAKLRMQFDKLLLICSSKNLPSNSYIYDAVLALPFSGRKALAEWLEILSKQLHCKDL